MKTKKIVLILYVLMGLLFAIGSVMYQWTLLVIGNFFLMPFLLLYYRVRAKRIFFPIVAILLLFYVRDLFLIYGFSNNPFIILLCFLTAMLFLFLCIITGFEKSKVHPFEFISFLIMYAFLGFMFISLSDVVPDVVPGYHTATYIYLFLLMLLMAVSFTFYLMKSHFASLWLMLASASLLVSEISLFFKVYIVEDYSVNIFFPIFHVFAYYGLAEYGLNRRRTFKLKYF